MIDTVFLNGTVGTGKSTVASALGEREETAGCPHAVIDLDQIRRAWPAAPNDPFNHELELQNLRSLAANYRRAGVEHFIVAGVVELQSEVSRYTEALGASGLLLCRLKASADVLEARLRSRHEHEPSALEWHLNRVTELDTILTRAALDSVVVDTSSRTPHQIAEAVSAAAGWS